jgi:hypothetical protein
MMRKNNKPSRGYLLIGALGLYLLLEFAVGNDNQGSVNQTLHENDGIIQCACAAEIHKMRRFFRQRDFNVCEIACAGSNKFASSFSEADLIGDGFELMSKSNVAACILCRDVVPLLPNISRSVRALSQEFASMHLTIIENDSSDNTVAALKEWSDFEEKHGVSGLSIDIEHHVLQLTRPAILNAGYDDADYASARLSRYHRLSLLRNRCLLSAMSLKHIDQLIFIDADSDVDRDFEDVHGVAHSYGLNAMGGKYKWDVVCANSLLQQPKGVKAYLHRNVSEVVPEYARKWVFRDSLAFRDKAFSIDTFRFHERRIHTPYDEPYFVDTCFGGIAIYDIREKNNIWHQCSYEAYKDNDCEHISFHACLRSLGWRILFNPRMTVQYF